MDGKLSCWTVTWINGEGFHNMGEPETKEDVFEFLEGLKDSGQDMGYVSVFPPNSNLTYGELVHYK